MPKTKSEETLDTQNNSRSLGIALGATEIVFLLGLVLLTTGSLLVFGVQFSVFLIGAVLVVSAWLMQFAK